MTELTKINLAELSGTYEPIPDGEYEVKLVDLDPTISSKDKPMLVATFRIMKGPHKSSEIKQWYSLAGKKSDKTGKYSYPGVRAMFDIFHAIGVEEKDYAKDFPIDKIAAGRIFKEKLHGKTLEVYITTAPQKDDPSKTSTRVKVTGVTGGAWSGGAIEAEEYE
jgi:uncharacterized protein DUF669